MNTNQAFENLKAIEAAAHDVGCGIPFLIAGTLLGAVREKGFIPGDHDTDVGIFNTEYRPELIDALTARGFHILRRFGDLSTGYLIAMERGGEYTDIYLFYDDPQHKKVFHCAWKIEGGLARAYRYRFDRFKPALLDFLGHKFFAPDDPVHYLEQTYPEWLKPNPNYDYTCDPLNLEVTDILMPMKGVK